MALPTITPARPIAWIPVVSSWIKALAFQPYPGSTYGVVYMETLAKKGSPSRRYAYSGCPRFVWQQLRDGASKGKGWWATKMRAYPCSRVT